MIRIFGTLVKNDDISRCFFFHVFKILAFWTVTGVKGKKWTKMAKKPVMSPISGTIHHMIVIYGTHVISRLFLFFKNFDFSGC